MEINLTYDNIHEGELYIYFRNELKIKIKIEIILNNQR